MTFHGHVQNGVIVLEGGVPLPEGTSVRVEVITPQQEAQQQSENEPGAKSLYETLRPVIGSVTDMPADAATNLDHYLYGHPKQQ